MLLESFCHIVYTTLLGSKSKHMILARVTIEQLGRQKLQDGSNHILVLDLP